MLVLIDFAHCSVNEIKLQRLKFFWNDKRKKTHLLHFFHNDVQNFCFTNSKVCSRHSDFLCASYTNMHTMHTKSMEWFNCGMTHGNHFSLWVTFKFWTNFQLLTTLYNEQSMWLESLDRVFEHFFQKKVLNNIFYGNLPFGSE